MNGEGLVEWRDEAGRLHRENGPARVFPSGREDGAPACVYVNGTEKWYRHGLRHRDPEEGPAASYPDGRRIWFVDGVKVKSERVR